MEFPKEDSISIEPNRMPVAAWLANALSLICMTLTAYYWFLFAMAKIRRAGKRPSRRIIL
ncbi:unknown [Firmicutes bacterium CAG:534]|nr:unknown [Firmicutes bacterium CAG:534]